MTASAQRVLFEEGGEANSPIFIPQAVTLCRKLVLFNTVYFSGMLGKRTLVIEGNDRVGAKILISGGGRCNFTNLYTSIDNFVSENPHFLHGVFSQWTVEDTCAFFERYGGIQGKEKTLGQLFPS